MTAMLGRAADADEPVTRPRVVFVSDFTHLTAPFAAVAPLMLAPDCAWVSNLQAREHRPDPAWTPLKGFDGAVVVELEVGPIARAAGVPVQLRVGRPREAVDCVVTPLAWSPMRLAGLLPELDGDLQVSPLDEEGTASRLGLYGRYAVPLGGAGLTIDRLAMHRIAESTIRGFLREVSEAITSML